LFSLFYSVSFATASAAQTATELVSFRFVYYSSFYV